ncbi:glycoside hydrolase family 5 protein [Actinomadura violacea]|uniref:Cellulase family glycosylhydrolase n=1 Tax=Actinomadura violacea TaxID=2819934 RepID=A0ABS3RLB1_9ACTN|nr:cellulase family glycosylhydrolase [Actinomadura violacea]MBO2457522.1 cellulase family glycosylhydrolase [Actinomadura violacea]
MGSRWLVPTVVGVVLGLLLAGALLDPVGFFALLGMPGRLMQAARWQVAPLVVYVPLLLAGTALVAAAFGHLGRRTRFATVWAGFVLAAVVAKAAMALAATVPGLNVADLLWATSFTVPKAALYALVPAAATLLIRVGERRDEEPAHRAHWPIAAINVAVVAMTGPWVSSHWSRDLPHGLPSASPHGGAAGLLAGLLVLFLALARTQRTFARRSRTPAGAFLGGWLAAMWAGIVLGAVQVAGLVVVDGPGAPLQTPAALWVRLGEGASLGAAVGWAPGLLAFLAARGAFRWPAARTVPATALVTAVVAAGAAGAVAATRPEPPPAPRKAVVAAAGTEPSALRVVRGKHPRIVDGEGRQVLLRGVNVNQLVDFYAPRPGVPATLPLSEDDFAQMAALGLNVVRLGVSWSRIEPRPAQYDEGYLRRIDQAVAWAKKHGLYTVIDMHQDGWSNAPTPRGTSCPPGTSRMDGYDGAPAWATKTDGAPRCQFTGRDISPAGDRAFTNFYYDRDGVQSRLAKVWAMLAARFGADPAVAGFDPLNEPGFGEQAPLTSTLLLGRFYDRVLHAIRGAESRPHPLFVEPSIFWSGTGFDAVPRGSFASDPDIVFAPHLYAESITMDASLGLPVMTSVEHGFVLARRAAGDMPVWSGEWGFWGDDGPVADRLHRYARHEDDDAIGGAFWVWKQACGDPQNGTGPTGNGLNNLDCATQRFLPRDAAAVQEISRAFPHAAPGIITSLRSLPGGRPSQPRKFQLTGRSSAGSCTLKVWVPGSTRPTPTASGIDQIDTPQVEGGWMLTGCAHGSYRLTLT